jgi:hypothetical protein
MKTSSLLIIALLLTSASARAQYNGFDVSNATVPKSEIRRGGPPRDGIPAILKPKFTSIAGTDWLRDDDVVMGFGEGEQARAYPLRILNWHEIVNDTVGDKRIVVTYCPLCGTGMVFDRVVEGKERTFGVSGLLYQSDVLMYDHQTESLWSQLMMESVAGKSAGQKLPWLPSEQTTWKAWRERNPKGQVLSTDTGHRRDYSRDPYTGYAKREETIFPVPKHRADFGNKEWVVGVIINGQPKAYPVTRLQQKVTDKVGGQIIHLTHDRANGEVRVTDEKGNALPSVGAFWFAWQAFYPKTEVYSPQR